MVKWFGKRNDERESVIRVLSGAGSRGLTTIEIQWAKGLPQQRLEQLLSDFETEDKIYFQDNRCYLKGVRVGGPNRGRISPFFPCDAVS